MSYGVNVRVYTTGLDKEEEEENTTYMIEDTTMPDGVEAPYITPDAHMKAVLQRTFQRPPYNQPTAADIASVKIQIEVVSRVCV